MIKHTELREHQLNIDILIDLLFTALSFSLSYLLKQYLLPEYLLGLKPDVNYALILFLILIIWYVVFKYFDVKFLVDRTNFISNITQLILPIVIAGFCLIMLLFIFKIENVSRLLIGFFLIFDFTLLSLTRWFVYSRLSDKYPLHSILVIVIGSKTAAREILDSIIGKTRGIEIIGCLELDEDDVGKTVIDDIKVIGTIKELEQILRQKVIDEIVFVMPIDKIMEGEKYLAVAQAVGVKIRIIPHWHIRKFLAKRPKFYAMSYEIFGDVPSLIFSPTPHKRWALLIKSIIDFSVSAIGLLLLLPVFVIVGMLIKIKSSGPIFYKQERLGLFGRKFLLYKFRTMIPGADKLLDTLKDKNISDGPTFKVKDDPRVIPGIGKFLRSTGLDELPQLINVLKGEMSLVGPRPPIPEEVDKYDLWERRRLSMKPGITCIWQVSPNRNLVSFKQWMEMDLYYIDNWSLWLDFKILFKTFLSIFKRYGM